MQTELPAVIGIAGAKRTGKDTLAQFLVERHGYERHAFADPLKELALRDDRWVAVFEETPVRLSEIIDRYGWEMAKDRFPEVRRTLQFLGTEVVRSVKEDHWINLMNNLIREASVDGRKIVVPDIRFQNERDLISAWGGLVVELTRPGFDPTEPEHVSEQRIAGDLVLVNDSSPEALYEAFIRGI